ncbi:MAG: transposase [Limnochordia bacterium]
MDGKREILAVEPMYEESEESYTSLIQDLKNRGLENVWLAVSDAHAIVNIKVIHWPSKTDPLALV